MKKLFYSETMDKLYSLFPIMTDYTSLPPYFTSHFHIHPVYHVVFVLNGHGKLTLGRETLHLAEKDIVIINPNETHIFSTEDKELFYFAVNFHLIQGYDIFKSLKECLNSDFWANVHTNQQIEVTPLERILNIETENSKIFYNKDTWSLIKKEIEYFYTNLQNNLRFLRINKNDTIAFWDYTSKVYDFVCNLSTKHLRSDRSLDPQVKDPLIMEIISYLEANLNEKFDLKHLSNHINYNASYISRIFNQKMNMNLSEYFNLLKISKSSILLRGSNKSITEIAYLLGYNSSQHFCRRFKEVKRVTPSEYRNNIELI